VTWTGVNAKLTVKIARIYLDGSFPVSLGGSKPTADRFTEVVGC
jgi:hypothetical protein